MPIIDPSLAFSFLNSFEKADSQLAKNFFPYFLAIASKQKINNLYATKAYIRFKKHVSGYSNFFSSKQIYDFNLSSDFISQIAKKNLYELLIENINLDTNNLDLKGSYKIYDQFDMKFFQPYVLFPSNHNWLLTTNPIAILCINTYELENNELFFQLINLEIDLMAASGYTLVLCIDYEKNISIEENISDIINQHPFAEIHFNIYPKNNKLLEECNGNFHESTLNFILNIFKDQKIDGYFYLYSSFDGLNNQSDVILKTLHLNYHNFDNLSFNKHPLDSLKNISLRHIKPFLYCENGFDFDEIQLILYNVPIYNEIDEENDLTPFNVSSIKMVYISKKDFINNWDQKRKMIFINDETKNNSLSIKYVDFDDIHIIKPNLIVKNTFYLSNAIPASFVDDIDEIIDYIEDQKNVDYKEGFKDQFLALFNTITEEKLISCLSLVSSLYTKILSENLKCEFKLRKSQLIAVLFSCAEVLNIVDKNKGFAFQVSTGEGKSCIIHLIAAIFSLLKKKVHIVSSNILLSLRDYQFSYNFFKELKITSAIFLHKNERPFKNYNTLNEKTKEFFPSTYFSDDKFDNSSSMNYCSCDMKKGAQIIFSTFVNFECYYLRMVETSPDDIKKYYKNTFLIVDEADSILIDEINNGTILSHPMKTNVEEVLTYIYTKKKKNIDPSQILLKVKEKWPDCQDMTISDIKYMFHEIDLVNSDEFQNGLKYYIEPTKSINEKKVDEVIEFYKDLIGDDDKLKNEILSINQNDQQFDKNNNKKQIIPFDYDHKGILEPNKEFSGFVQQFIAIKEKLSTKEDINVKELSMNYLYVSHPTFIKNYENVLCFTGTIGNDKDKHVFITQYDLIPIDIPKENADLRVDFPIIICKTIPERNNKIFEEMMNFHQRDYPVLIIFNDMIEIGTFCSLLETKKVKRYNIFDGSEEKIKPDFIAGIKGQISLGTNFCGRGTDIKIYDKPLHVIVSYYTNNERVMEQALGRTARQGSKGTTRIICIEKDFLAATRELDENEMNETLNEFLIKNKIQTEFIEKYKKNRRWIFDNKIDEQIISSACLSKMREARINVNRKTAYEFTYPICMSVDTFLDIQAQKIFSLYNCPNCKYTWLIFRKYIREMIFESYSITMNKVDKLYYLREGVEGKSYEDFLRENINDLYKKLEEYLPSSSNIFDNKILPTFMNIFNICLKKHENYILDFYPNSLTNIMSKSEFKYVSFFFGFKPFTLMNKSGAKINSVNGENQEMNYIEDPELKYYQMNIFKNKISISITKKIDQIFNELCNRINETINSFIGLNFFLRRTLGGCEFGVCFNMNSIQLGSNKNDYKLLVDKNPLLLFTIYVKSINPILAGILIFGLIYIASISKTISEFIKVFKGGKAIKDTLKSVVLLLLKSDDDNDNLFTKSIDFVFEKIESFLNEKIESQIKQITDESTQQIFIILKDIFDNNDFNEVTSKINKLFQDKFLFSMEDMSVSDVLPMKKFFRLGILLLLCFSSFMINFNSCHKSLSYNPEKVAIEYNDQQNLEKSINDNSYLSQNDIIQYNENGKEISLDDSSFWILEIDIIEAIDIPKMDVIGWADPYVTFFFSSDPKTIHKTDFIPDSKNPKWNASFKMTINNNKDEKIIFHLMDRDQGFITDDLISYIDIHIKNLPLERKMQKWYDMIPSAKAKKGAKLHLSFNIHT